MGPDPIKEEFGHKHVHTERMPCANEYRDWGDAPEAKKIKG